MVHNFILPSGQWAHDRFFSFENICQGLWNISTTLQLSLRMVYRFPLHCGIREGMAFEESLAQCMTCSMLFASLSSSFIMQMRAQQRAWGRDGGRGAEQRRARQELGQEYPHFLYWESSQELFFFPFHPPRWKVTWKSALLSSFTLCFCLRLVPLPQKKIFKCQFLILAPWGPLSPLKRISW